jgi:uroporphyrin-III C-methyltransferase / precorrin-2 dehydrogenase / sirohydrochlorin ferrochelatase
MSLAPPLHPLFLKLQGRPVTLVGGGEVARAKLTGLLASGAEVTVVAPDIREDIAAAKVQLRRRAFQPSDLDGAWLAVAAADAEVNRRVSLAAEARRLFVVAVDDPAVGSAYAGGVLRKGGVTVALSTDGLAPALAGLLREALESVLPDDLARWVQVAHHERGRWRASGVPMAERRPLLLRALVRLYERHPEDERAATGGMR